MNCKRKLKRRFLLMRSRTPPISSEFRGGVWTPQTPHPRYATGWRKSRSKWRKAVRELKNGKSCGPEGVYAEILKHGTEKLIKMLTWVINRCLNGEEIPQQWKVAYISSISKKGSKEYCSNYRGISVTSVMSWLYGKILRDLIEEENKDEDEQSGFRTGRSCTSFAWNKL